MSNFLKKITSLTIVFQLSFIVQNNNLIQRLILLCSYNTILSKDNKLLGIIDIMTEYNSKKKVQNRIKKLLSKTELKNCLQQKEYHVYLQCNIQRDFSNFQRTNSLFNNEIYCINNLMVKEKHQKYIDISNNPYVTKTSPQSSNFILNENNSRQCIENQINQILPRHKSIQQPIKQFIPVIDNKIIEQKDKLLAEVLFIKEQYKNLYDAYQDKIKQSNLTKSKLKNFQSKVAKMQSKKQVQGYNSRVFTNKSYEEIRTRLLQIKQRTKLGLEFKIDKNRCTKYLLELCVQYLRKEINLIKYPKNIY